MLTAADVIALLDLKPLPVEGGYFRETYRSGDVLRAGIIPHYSQDRAAATAIYYLLTPETFSAMHRLPTEEIFHFYLGDPVLMLQLGPAGGQVVMLGTDLQRGQRPQVVVPRGVWQGSCLQPGGSLALMGTTMTPGFDFADYEGGQRSSLSQQYPAFAEMISQLTRE